MHLCYIYNDEAERREVMARFVNSGIESGELVAYFADVDADVPVTDYLAGMGIRLPKAGSHGQLRPLRARDVYVPDNHFSPDRMLGKLCSFHNECKAAHHPSLRITGETNWTLSGLPGCDRFIEYDARINTIIDTLPAAILCQFDANRFDGGTLYDILSVHPMMIVRGHIVRNPYYVTPEEFLLHKRK